MGRGLKLYNGHGWEDKHANARIYDGNGGWHMAKTRLWDGHNWILVSEERHEKVWNATWTQAYWSSKHGFQAKARGWDWRKYNYLYQGNYSPFTDRWDWGDQGGMIGFDDGNIRWELSGARIEAVYVYLYAYHWAWYAGGTARIGTHNASGWQSRFQEANGVVAERNMRRNEGAWIQLPNWVGDNLRDNKLKGLTTHAHTNNNHYYGYFAGANAGWQAPKLKIVYWK